MTFVDSSNIEAIGYSEADLELWVRFLNQRTYIYDGVPSELVDELMRSPSKGSYLNREIKSKFGFRDA